MGTRVEAADGDGELTHVSRVPASVRKLAVVIFVMFVAFAAILTAIGITVPGTLCLWLLVLLILLTVWRWYLLPYIGLAHDALVVQGAFVQRSARYADIRDARPGMYGLRIETTGEGSMRAWAVQKSQLSEWRGRDTLADIIAAEIMVRAAHATADDLTT